MLEPLDAWEAEAHKPDALRFTVVHSIHKKGKQ